MSFWAIKVICFENHKYEGWIVRDPIQYIWETLIVVESNHNPKEIKSVYCCNKNRAELCSTVVQPNVHPKEIKSVYCFDKNIVVGNSLRDKK